METSPPVSLDELCREWIVGVSGAAFHAAASQSVARMETIGEPVWQKGVLIAEQEPVAFAASFMAAVVLGVPVVLGNPGWGRVEWSELFGQVKPACVFGSAELLESNGIKGAEVSLERGSILIPTGGSSGGVKLARHDWKSLAAACQGVFDFLGPGPVNSCCVLPLYHVSGLMQLVRSWLSGGQIIFTDFKTIQAGEMPYFEAETLCLSLVPTHLQRALASKSVLAWLKGLRAILLGGAFTPAAVLEKARTEALPLVLSYGMTETAAMVSALPKAAFLNGGASVGQALSHAQVEILGPSGGLCPPGQAGRIQVRANSLFKGYQGKATDRCSDVYLTDDEGYFDESGNLHIIGRQDRLIISGGEKIDPREVERVLAKKQGISAVLVVACPDEEWGQKLVAFYTSTEAEETGDLSAALKNDLAPHKIPKLIIRVPELPIDAKGKVDLNQVRRLL